MSIKGGQLKGQREGRRGKEEILGRQGGSKYTMFYISLYMYIYIYI
jgi:hypothetical protein